MPRSHVAPRPALTVPERDEDLGHQMRVERGDRRRAHDDGAVGMPLGVHLEEVAGGAQLLELFGACNTLDKVCERR